MIAAFAAQFNPALLRLDPNEAQLRNKIGAQGCSDQTLDLPWLSFGPYIDPKLTHVPR
jgi:hypothetical protein